MGFEPRQSSSKTWVCNFYIHLSYSYLSSYFYIHTETKILNIYLRKRVELMMQIALWKTTAPTTKDGRNIKALVSIHACKSRFSCTLWVQSTRKLGTKSRVRSLWSSKASLDEDQLDDGAWAESCEHPLALLLRFQTMEDDK